MESAHVSAIISAAAGISGVLLGNIFVLIKEWWTKRKTAKQDTAFLGIIVVSHLDRFATGCFHVALDDGTQYGQPAGERGEYVTVVTPPDFRPLDVNVDWKLLPMDLMYSILRLPDQQDQLQGNLAGIHEFNHDPPQHVEYFQARRRGYAVLGLQASDLAKKLRSYVGLPVEELGPDEWSRDESMKDVISDIDAKLSESLLRNAVLQQQ
ncbi:hypothetical protein BK672_02095 [Pseudomonas fluorescens]|uniref:Uncharacterized protein n=1 Tax=Pseudomonas fluorescens TaxID=294 RepID=A0A423NFS6_PSEFL|nr:hypothetical protein [Pseudomonas fluorescens]RON97109.1 hypothetical protein BK672_02095 [Pseudomonas fluorescens]